MEKIKNIIQNSPLNEKKEVVSYLKQNIDILNLINSLSYKEKQQIYDLFENYINKLKLNFFSFKQIEEIDFVFQQLINIHINLLIDLKKHWIENYFTIFKWTWKYRVLKALSLFRFAKDITKLSFFLMEQANNVFEYLHKAYKLEENDELIFKVFKQYISRIFSTPEYISERAKKELIENLKLNKNFSFFYWIKKYRNYIEKNITEQELIEEIKDQVNKEQLDLSWLRIWLIFGDKNSVKSYKKYIKKSKAIDFIKQIWLTNFETNFEILEEDFKKQKNIEINVIKNRLWWIYDKLDLILCFEIDHRTKFYDSLLNDPELWWKIILNTKDTTGSNQSWQHFSFNKFEKMLSKWIDNYINNKWWNINITVK